MIYKVSGTPLAREMFLEITDRRIRQQISVRTEELKTDPEKRGKRLEDELIGFRSVRASAQRYRIVYSVHPKEGIVKVVGVGIRKEGDKKDIYERLKKLARMGLLPK